MHQISETYKPRRRFRRILKKVLCGRHFGSRDDEFKKERRRSSFLEALSNVLKEEENHEDVLRKRRRSSTGRSENLTKELRAIRKTDSKVSNVNTHQRMVETWHDAIRAYLSPAKATSDWAYAWRLHPDAPTVRFAKAASANQSKLLKAAKYWKIIKCIFSVAISFIDYAFAFALAINYFAHDQVLYALLSLLFPFLALCGHAYIAVTDKESWRVIAASLVGFKPFIDTYRLIASGGNEKSWSHRTFHPIISMAIGRVTELVFESIPQTMLQTYLILRFRATGVDVMPLQYYTVISSLTSVGFIAALLDYDLDTSRYKKVEPKLYGFIPESFWEKNSFYILQLDTPCIFLRHACYSMWVTPVRLPIHILDVDCRGIYRLYGNKAVPQYICTVHGHF